jgi:glycosyltransferase involved in cell wall biosynthesis
MKTQDCPVVDRQEYEVRKDGSPVGEAETPLKRHCYMLAGSWSESPVSTHFRALADELAARGHTVVFLVDRCNHEVENHTGNPAVYTWPSFRPTRVRDAWFLRRLIKNYRPDFVIGAFGSTNWMTVVGWLMRVRCRLVWYLTLSDQIETDGQIGRWKLNLLNWRKRLVYSLATHVIPNSLAGSEDVQRVHGVSNEKCNVLYLSLPDPKRELGEFDFRFQKDRTICVGRFNLSKGQDVLLKSIARLKDRFPHAVFEFVGDGPCKAACEQLARELGLRRMAQSYVSVVPSRNECFGLVNIESLAMGTPVIASDVGGIGEILRDGEEGYLVPPDDPESLADRLAAILSDPELRDRMSRKATMRFTRFEQSNLIGEQVDWIESL